MNRQKYLAGDKKKIQYCDRCGKTCRLSGRCIDDVCYKKHMEQVYEQARMLQNRKRTGD